MNTSIIREKQDLTYLKWSHIRNSSGTAGTFLKSESILDGQKTYYKLSNFDSEKGVIGHECINEIIVDRLLTILEVPHLSYQLINADIEVDGRIYNTYLCASEDFKEKGESKWALDDYYNFNSIKGESHYDFCIRCGFKDYIDQMLAVDDIILNRDRHGANIELLRNPRKHAIRIAPLFDHGLSLLYTCDTDEAIEAYEIMEDKPCNNFIGSRSCWDNLKYIENKTKVFSGHLKKSDRAKLFEDLEGVISESLIDKIWEMIYKRYSIYEKL
jgi:hypothetical protein